jgi:hypothetical protein
LRSVPRSSTQAKWRMAGCLPSTLACGWRLRGHTKRCMQQGL